MDVQCDSNIHYVILLWDGCDYPSIYLHFVSVYIFSHHLCIHFHYHVSCAILRLLVECRFQPGTVLTVSYLVKTPTFGPEVHTQGMFGVQLRIAKGECASFQH